MSINCVVISNIKMEYTPEYIVSVLWSQGIAKVSEIVLMSYTRFYQKAFITIAEWCDTEAAYKFIQSVKTTGTTIGEWEVHNNSTWITTRIPKSFYEEDEKDNDDCWSDDDCWSCSGNQEEVLEEKTTLKEEKEEKEEAVIRVYDGCEKFTVTDAKMCLELLYKNLNGGLGMNSAQIAKTIYSVEAQIAATLNIRTPIAPSLPQMEEKIIKKYKQDGFMTLKEAADRHLMLSKRIMELNFAQTTQPSFEETNIFDYCEEVEFIEDQIEDRGYLKEKKRPYECERSCSQKQVLSM